MEKKAHTDINGNAQKVASLCRNCMSGILVWMVRRTVSEAKYYTPEYGFNDVITYTDSESMFEDLWQECLRSRLHLSSQRNADEQGMWNRGKSSNVCRRKNRKSF